MRAILLSSILYVARVTMSAVNAMLCIRILVMTTTVWLYSIDVQVTLILPQYSE